MYICIYVNIYTDMYKYKCIYETRRCEYVYRYTYIHMYVWDTSMRIYIQIYMNTYVYMGHVDARTQV